MGQTQRSFLSAADSLVSILVLNEGGDERYRSRVLVLKITERFDLMIFKVDKNRAS